MADNGLFEPAAGTVTLGRDNGLLVAPPSMADAYDYHAQALQKWMAEQRAAGVAAGTNDPETGWPTQKGIIDGVRQWGDAMIGSTTAPGFRAYHGSPHSFDAFDSAKIGTGEGAQAFGHGLYLADSEGVARSYRDKLAGPADRQTLLADGKPLAPGSTEHQLANVIDTAGFPAAEKAVQTWTRLGQYGPEWSDALASLKGKTIERPPAPGHMYEVQVNADPAHFLDWDKPRDQLAPAVQAFAKEHTPQAWENAADGSSLYHGMAKELGSHGAASDAMAKAGIPGIRYLDGGSRADGTGTSNHVIFDANTIAILRKYGIAGLIAGGGAAAAGNQSGTP